MLGTNNDSIIDTWEGIGQYRHHFGALDGKVTSQSHQLVIAPVWDIFDPAADFCPGNELGGGATASISVVGFASIFIEGRKGGNVITRLVSVTGCGNAGTSGPALTESGPFGRPLRLVRPE